MQIVLIRHGRPALLRRSAIAGRDLGRWSARYDAAGIVMTPPPSGVQEIVASAPCVVASDLRRSIESARLLSPRREVRIDPDLREAALPDSVGGALVMPPGLWIGVARLAWWLGCCRSAEPVEATRRRASLAADRLCALADEWGAVAVVGHGIFNLFLGRQLRRRGWAGPRAWIGRYWATASFTRDR